MGDTGDPAEFGRSSRRVVWLLFPGALAVAVALFVWSALSGESKTPAAGAHDAGARTTEEPALECAPGEYGMRAIAEFAPSDSSGAGSSRSAMERDLLGDGNELVATLAEFSDPPVLSARGQHRMVRDGRLQAIVETERHGNRWYVRQYRACTSVVSADAGGTANR